MTTTETDTAAVHAADRWSELPGGRSVTRFGSVTLIIHRIAGLEGWHATSDPDLFRCQKLRGAETLEQARKAGIEMLRKTLESTLAAMPGGTPPAELWALATSAGRRAECARIRKELLEAEETSPYSWPYWREALDRICPEKG